MKREDVKNKIPGITDEQLNWLMQENGADINREKSAATALQTQLNNVNHLLEIRAVVGFCGKGAVNVVLDDRDAVLFRIGGAFPDLSFDGFLTLVVAGTAGVEYGGHTFTSGSHSF